MSSYIVSSEINRIVNDQSENGVFAAVQGSFSSVLDQKFSRQVIYLDFDGATASYRNRDLNIAIEDVIVENSGFDAMEVAYIVDVMNSRFGDDIVFTSVKPDAGEYSTIYIGVTSAFDGYGTFTGIAETIDSGNHIRNDNAFVMLDSTAGTGLVTHVIEHETKHIVAGLEHDGEYLEPYAAIIAIYSGQTSANLTVTAGNSLYIMPGGYAGITTVNNGGWMGVASGGMAINVTVNAGGSMHIVRGGNVSLLQERGGYVSYEAGASVSFNKSVITGLTITGNATVHGQTTAQNVTLGANGKMYIYTGGVATQTVVNQGGALVVTNNGNANGTTVNSSGTLLISSGGVGSDTVVSAGGSVVLMDGAVLNGIVNIAGGQVLVSGGVVASSATMNFDIGNYSSAATIYSANNLVGASYSVTVGDTQAYGQYTLASGFTTLPTITVKNTAGITLGEVSVGKSLVYDNKSYSLASGSSLVLTVAKPDTEKPTITVTGNPTSWTKNDVTLTASFVDNVGVATKQYSYDNSTWYNYTTALKITENATVYFKVADAAGNIATQTVVVDKIDKTAPTVAISGNPTSWTNNDVTLTAAFSDTGSGIVTKQYSYDNSTWYNFTTALTVSENKTVYFKATDAVGNIATQTVVVDKIDKTAPTVTISGKPTSWTKNDVTLTVAFSDTVSGIATKQYSYDNRTWYNFTTTLTVTENRTVYFKAADAAGNSSGVKSVVVNKIDKILPTITVTGNPTTETAGSVTLTATFSDTGSGIATKQYSYDNSTWYNYTTALTVTENRSVYFKATDSAGNIATKTVTVDKIIPVVVDITVSGNPTSWTKNNVTLTASFSSNAAAIATKQYSYDNSTWQNYTGALTVTENRTVYFRATDAAGNVATQTVVVNKIDKTLPTVTIDGNPTSWTKNNVTLTASFSDTGSGIATKQYSYDNSTWYNYTTALTVTENRTVYFRATDNVGNSSGIKSAVVDKIDKTLPTITVTGNPTVEVAGSVTLTAEFADTGSGIATKQYSYDNKTWQNYTTALTITENKTVYFRATDNAGNTATRMEVVDKIVPAQVAITVTGNPTSWTKNNVTLTASFSSNAAAIATKQYSYDNSTWYNYTTALTVTENRTVYFKATDKAGNSATQTVVVNKIDKTLPTVTIDGNPTAWTKNNVTLTATFADKSGSGIATKQYSYDNKTWQNYTTALTVTENRTVYFRATDNVGNSATQTVTVNKIDKTLPTITVSGNPTVEVAGSVTLTAEFADTGSGIATKQYSYDNKTWQNYTTALTITENKTVYFRATDNAGNTATRMEVVDKIVAADVNITVTGNPTSWTKNNVTLTASFSSNAAAIATKQYSYDNSTWQNYTTALTVIENRTVYFRATDKAGNSSGVKSVVVSKIDKTAPTVTIDGNPTAWTKNNVTLTATFADEGGSGIATKQYSYDNKTWQNYTGVLTITENRTIYFKATDNAGNSSGVKSVVVDKIDKIAPQAPTAKVSITKPTNQDVTVTATFSSDSVQKQYSYDNRTWQNYTTALTISENKTVYFRGIDAAGNISEVASCPVTNIDKEAPVIGDFSISQGANDYTFTVTVDAQDNLTPKDKLTYKIGYGHSINSLEWVNGTQLKLTDKYIGESYLFEVKAIDEAGNEVTTAGRWRAFGVRDVTPPTVSGTPTASLNGQNVTLRWSAAKDNVGIQKYKVIIGTKEYSAAGTETSLTVSNLAAGTYGWKVVAVDEGGNETAYATPKSFTVKQVAKDSTFKWNGNVYAYIQVPGLGKSSFKEDTGFNDDGNKYYMLTEDWFSSSKSIVDAEKGSTTEKNFYLYMNTCWAATASNMFVRAGWSDGVFKNEDEVLKFFCNNFTLSSDPEKGYQNGYKGVTGGLAEEGLDWLLNGYYGKWVDWDNDKALGWSGPESTETGGFYKNSIGSSDEYLFVSDATYDDFLYAMEKLQQGYAVGLGVAWMKYAYPGYYWTDKYGNQYTTLRDGGHAITVYGFTYDENQKGKPEYFTGIIVADSDDDFGYPPGHLTSYPPENAPNRLKILEINYNKSRGCYEFDTYGSNNSATGWYKVGQITDLQYLAPRPDNVTYTLSSKVGFADNDAWNAKYSVGVSAEAALSGERGGRLTAADDIFVALNLANSGLGALSDVTVTAVIDGDTENPLNFTISKNLAYDESDAETVINLGKIGYGAHNISITVSADGVQDSIAINNLNVAHANSFSNKFSAYAGYGSTNQELKNGDLLTVFADGIATGCVVTANSEQSIKANGISIGSRIYANGVLTVETDGTANDSEIFDAGFLIVNGNANGTVVHAGGALFADRNSSVTSTTVEVNGLMDINYRGSAADTDVYGDLFVTNGVAGETTVYAGGSLFVLDTGVAEVTVVQNSGKQYVASGGSASDTTVIGVNGEQYVADNGSIAVGNLIDGASQFVGDSGVVMDNTLLNGALQDLSGGAAAYNTELLGDSLQYIWESTAYGTTIGAGCVSFVYEGGIAVASDVKSDGYIVVGDVDGYFGVGSVRNLTVEYGGYALLYGGATLFGANVFAGKIAVTGEITGASAGIEDSSPYIVFDLSERTAADDFIISDITLCSGLYFSIDLAETQSVGRYKLSAKGADAFDGSFTVYDKSGAFYGMIDTDRFAVMGDRLIALERESSGLYVSVTASPYAACEIPSAFVANGGGGGSWGHIAGGGGYLIQLSRDGFENCITVRTDANAVTMNNLPFDLEWRIRPVNSDVWTEGGTFVANAEDGNSLVTADKNWDCDIIFAKASTVWDAGFAAEHQGVADGWSGLRCQVALGGKNKISDIFESSSDADVLLLTDDANGDALFVDDVYTSLPGGVAEQQSRIAKIDEIRAGAGDDVVDLTSRRFEYIGSGLTIRGGFGDDVIWANKGDNSLFGDAGNDRLVGASGDDVLVGGIGDDRMHGGGGSDIFTFCENWGVDTVEQLAAGSVTLWFASGNSGSWDAAALTYTDGANSVTVKGVTADKVTLKFGDDGSARYTELTDAGAFAEFTSEKIFEEKGRGLLA